MIIKILGTGCAKCKLLEENAQKAISESEIDAEVIKITDLNDIMNYGVMITPALVIDEKVKSAGTVLTPDEIKAFIK